MVNTITQYNIVQLVQTPKNSIFKNCCIQNSVKKEELFFQNITYAKNRFFKTLVRTTGFSKKENTFRKILHIPQTALYSTVFVGCMYGVSTVLVQRLYGTHMVHLGICREFCVQYKSFALCIQ